MADPVVPEEGEVVMDHPDAGNYSARSTWEPAFPPVVPEVPVTQEDEWLKEALKRMPELAPVVDAALDAIPAEPLTPESRQRFLEAAERGMKPRREILLLAAHASGHLVGAHHSCRVCHQHWPCDEVQRVARPALDAVADLS